MKASGVMGLAEGFSEACAVILRRQGFCRLRWSRLRWMSRDILTVQ